MVSQLAGVVQLNKDKGILNQVTTLQEFCKKKHLLINPLTATFIIY